MVYGYDLPTKQHSRGLCSKRGLDLFLLQAGRVLLHRFLQHPFLTRIIF